MFCNDYGKFDISPSPNPNGFCIVEFCMILLFLLGFVFIKFCPIIGFFFCLGIYIINCSFYLLYFSPFMALFRRAATATVIGTPWGLESDSVVATSPFMRFILRYCSSVGHDSNIWALLVYDYYYHYHCHYHDHHHDDYHTIIIVIIIVIVMIIIIIIVIIIIIILIVIVVVEHDHYHYILILSYFSPLIALFRRVLTATVIGTPWSGVTAAALRTQLNLNFRPRRTNKSYSISCLTHQGFIL
ncbi:uncharacterized protein LOC116160212 [Photinus pyralis]|uniref:uncharacterized protein LOC116159131 n=1 Tax=Photinus pyralis TaxID=7054 RepID=UPI0012676B5E|nr:uncharacterized protein LOC116159131 [Photinus pyralis]XP_031327920.1 uncharacterized protein LOC116159131 [Photinus pyralis]XP_031327921.1 uncharacterized protein LOC116159131 [Photinus pyralis]XP_031328098.1 uncharacterized protein LOC116159287 [Photinus pyralis]XP_031328099.1 uncharacterized protein LOC116159287 [Photinus pyralis]XP_031328100.1 uncharacterized protein LOC116159287 [Photinus pyralis]XP_031329216.1 uncharacterized protein LOC116160212 [Photinus pyralis]XP_031329217.1 unc